MRPERESRTAKPRIGIVVASPFALNAFLRPHLERLARTFSITVYVNVRDMGVAPDVAPDISVTHFPVMRKISLLADAAAFAKLLRLLRRERFDMVLSMTPKAGLLAMVAAFAARIPRRIHYFTGQVWANRRGAGRYLLKELDRLTAACATHVLADSPSQRDFLVAEGVVGPRRIRVLADGSVAGVDLDRFCPDTAQRASLRKALGVPGDAPLLLYVGRLARDKGVMDLLAAFQRLRRAWPELMLLLIGPDDDGLEAKFQGIAGILRSGYRTDVERYMQAADIFCLPSYREGFGLVLIEAGAVGLPVVASRIYGVSDAVVDGETGLLHRPGDVPDLATCIEKLLGDEALRVRLGDNSRKRVAALFPTARLTAAMSDFVHGLFDSAVDQRCKAS